MVDATVVKNSDDIASMKKIKDENNAAIKILDMKIDKMNKEIEIKCNENAKFEFKMSSAQIKWEYCEKSFKIFSELENHILKLHEIHSKFKCDQCEKEFVSTWRLKKHMNIHI